MAITTQKKGQFNPYVNADIEDIDYEEILDPDPGGELIEETISPIPKEEKESFLIFSMANWWIFVLITLAIIIGAGIINNLIFKDDSKLSFVETNATSTLIPIKINGKDTLVTVGEYFPVSYGKEKTKKPSFAFNAKKYGKEFQSEDEINPNFWKENRDGTKVSGDQSLPSSWGNDQIYVWSKTGENGTAWFIITKK